MPKSPDSEGVPRLMTVTEIAEEHGVTRQTVHSYRKRGVFPKPVEGEGSTRPRFRADEVAAFFVANPKQPGKRTDLTDQQQGEPMATPAPTTVDPRIAILSDLSDPPFNEVTETRCVPWDEAEKMLAAYRAAVIAEVVEALQERAAEFSELAEEQERPSLEERAQEWYSAAEVAAKLKQPK